MSFPSDVLLPIDAKYFGFQYSLSGTQHGFCTFLTSNNSLSSGIPGQYLGYLVVDPYILDETSTPLTTEGGEFLTYEDGIEESRGVVAIAFDTTGYFALSNITNPGVSIEETKPNSLIVRDSNKNVVFNETLTDLDSDFILTENSFKTLRFRYERCGKRISIDWRKDGTYFRNLTTIELNSSRDKINVKLYPSFCFSSPISSSILTPSTLKLKNFHVQGMSGNPNYETSGFLPLTSARPTQFTSISTYIS